MIHKPFTYFIGWSQYNKWYYGKKTSKCCSPNDLWTTYFTSSKHVKTFREEFGEPDIIQVRKIFDNAKEASIWETKVLMRLKVATNDKWLNKTNGDRKWDTSGLTFPYKSRPSMLGSNNPSKRLEVRQKIKEKLKGRFKDRVPWNKGKKGLQVAWNKNLTKDDDVRIISGENHPSKREEVKLKIALGNTGKVFSEERKQNISIAKRKQNDI